MSRKIKFRAWIPAKKVGQHDYHSDGKAKMFYQEDQYLQSFLRRAYLEDCGREHESYISEGFTLLQCTGLKDRNGEAIYEGDVVRWGDHCDWCHESPVRVAQVQMEPDIQFNSQVGIFHFGNFAYGHPKDGLLEHLEVIGNIYENPELLQEAK